MNYAIEMGSGAMIYKGESVNWSQLDVKCKICDIQTWGKNLFLDISSTNIDTLVLSLYQCVETRSIEVFASVAVSTGRTGRASSATFESP
jgi:hypothetical protein